MATAAVTAANFGRLRLGFDNTGLVALMMGPFTAKGALRESVGEVNTGRDNAVKGMDAVLTVAGVPELLRRNQCKAAA